MPKVYIIEERPFDYTPAMAYGEVVVLGDVRFLSDAPSAVEHNEDELAKLIEDLQGYTPGVDYILPTGAPVKMLAAAMALVKMSGDRVEQHRILEWNPRNHSYSCYTLEI